MDKLYVGGIIGFVVGFPIAFFLGFNGAVGLIAGLILMGFYLQDNTKAVK